MKKQTGSGKLKFPFQSHSLPRLLHYAMLISLTLACGQAEDKKAEQLEKQLEELNAELETERQNNRKLEDEQRQPGTPPFVDQEAAKKDDPDAAPKEEATGLPAIPEKVPAEFKESATQCLKIWGKDAPFTKDSPVRALKPIEAGGPRTTLSDPEASEKPTLVLIPAAPNGPGHRYELLDPMAWYCLTSAPDGGSRVTIELKKGAHLIDTAETVKIDGKAEVGNVDDKPGDALSVRVIE